MDVYLVTGVPGAGKSTFSRAFAATFERGVHIEADVLSFEFVVSGAATPSGDGADPDEWDRQMALRRRNMCLLADSYAEAGFVPVLDDVVTHRSELDLCLRLLRARPLHFVVLAPSLAVASQRDAGREERVLPAWAHLDAELREDFAGLGLWIDTSALTVEDTIAAVRARRDDARIA